MEHLYALDNNSLIGMWMMLGFAFAVAMTMFADQKPEAKKAVQFFYTHPYSVGIYIILGPLMSVFFVRQMQAVTQA